MSGQENVGKRNQGLGGLLRTLWIVELYLADTIRADKKNRSL